MALELEIKFFEVRVTVRKFKSRIMAKGFSQMQGQGQMSDQSTVCSPTAEGDQGKTTLSTFCNPPPQKKIPDAESPPYHF